MNPEETDMLSSTLGGRLGIVRQGDIMRLSVAVELHLSHLRARILASTVRDRRPVLEYFARLIGNDVAVGALKPKHIQLWLDDQRPRVGAGTLRNRYSTIRSFIRDCLIRGWLRRDPTLGITLPRLPSRRVRDYTLAELRALGRVLPDNRARLIVSLGVFEGLRRVEIAHLEYDDIDFGASTLRFVSAKTRDESTIPLTDMTREGYLYPYLADRGRGSGPLIQHARQPGIGLTPHRLTHLMGEWVKAAGIKNAPDDHRCLHALRHTAGNAMAALGAPPDVIQKALRHRSLSTTYDFYINPRRSLDELRPWMGNRPPEAA